MKFIASILESVRPSFEKDGKLERLYPIFEAAESALLSPTIPSENPPYGRDPLDIKRYMFLVIVALLPCFFMAIYYFGWRVLLMLLVSYAAGAIIEVLFAVIRKEEINEGFLVTGFIFPLILPPGIPLWVVAVGMMFGTLVGKEIFGGTGRNLFNPAIVGRCFLALGYPAAMTQTWLEPVSGGWGRLLSPFSFLTPDAVTSATPLVLAKGGTMMSPIDLFLGRVAGSAGETSALAILVGGTFLLVIGIASWRTVFATLGSFVILGTILRGIDPSIMGSVSFHLLSGGILFGAFFMATDPVTSPITQSGKWVYGVIIGATTILIRLFSGYVEGVMFAILLGNICAPLIDDIIVRVRIRRYQLEQ